MIKSMTGFGRSESVTGERKIVVEIKAVNHRYCDLSIKLPKKFNFMEAGIRNLLKEYISRGKVDVFVSYEDYAKKNAAVKYNEELAKNYMSCLDQLAATFSMTNDVSAGALSRYPEVFTLEEQETDADEIWTELSAVFRKACESFVATRNQEGEHLKKDILQKLDGMEEMVAFIEERSPQILQEYRGKLMAKVSELLGDKQIDEAVLATELTIFADKICVDEETVRLKSHISSMRSCLAEGENIGRKLDFIAQEMNREANTILSKANDLQVSDKAIDLKTEIEKIREQIQNIE